MKLLSWYWFTIDNKNKKRNSIGNNFIITHCILLVNLFEYFPRDILSIAHRTDTMLSEGNYEFNIWAILYRRS